MNTRGDGVWGQACGHSKQSTGNSAATHLPNTRGRTGPTGVGTSGGTGVRSKNTKQYLLEQVRPLDAELRP